MATGSSLVQCKPPKVLPCFLRASAAFHAPKAERLRRPILTELIGVWLSWERLGGAKGESHRMRGPRGEQPTVHASELMQGATKEWRHGIGGLARPR